MSRGKNMRGWRDWGGGRRLFDGEYDGDGTG